MHSSRMLPGGLLQEPSAKRTTRDWIVDATMFVLALALGAGALASGADRHSGVTLAADLVIGLVCLGALWWRRRYPYAVALITIIPGAVSAMAAGAGAVGLFNIALRGKRRQIVISTVLAVLAGVAYTFVYPEPDSTAFEISLAVFLPAIIVPWALFARTQRNLLRSSHDRALRVEREQRAREDAAREAERRRIAGEMHDVLAHRLSLLSVHAGALEFNPDASPEEIAAAAGGVRATPPAAPRGPRAGSGGLRAGGGGRGP